jgi:rhodanese-related sulfurtransferase
MAKSIKTGSILTIVIVTLIAFLIYNYSEPVYKNERSLRISVDEARSRRFGLIIDVRTPKERELLGYYPNSIPISLDMINKQVPMDIAGKSTSILIYCNTGKRAEKAAEILYSMGYHNVRYINESYLSLMPGSQ